MKYLTTGVKCEFSERQDAFLLCFSYSRYFLFIIYFVSRFGLQKSQKRLCCLIQGPLQGDEMHTKSFSAAVLLALSLATLVGCSSNQSIKTSDGRTIVTDGKPQIDSDTGLVSYRDAQTGKTEQINRDQISNMSELDN